MNVTPARPLAGQSFEVTAEGFPELTNVGIVVVPAEAYFASRLPEVPGGWPFVAGSATTDDQGRFGTSARLSSPGKAGECFLVMARTVGWFSLPGPDAWFPFEYAQDFTPTSSRAQPEGCIAYMLRYMQHNAAKPSSSRIWLTPVTGPPGTWTTLQGVGLSPGQRVDVRLQFAIGPHDFKSDPLVRRMVVDNLGTFSLRVRFPVDGKCLGITASTGPGTRGGGLWIPTGPDQPRPKPDRCAALDALGFAFEGGEEASDPETQQGSVTMTPRAVASGATFHVRVTGLSPSTPTRMYVSIRSSDRGGWGTPVEVGTSDASGVLEANVTMPRVPEADGKCSHVVFSTIPAQAEEVNVVSKAFDYVLR